jgi:signal peptidase II
VSNAPAKSSGIKDGRAIPTWRYLLFLLIAISGCGLDLWTKHAVFAWRGMPRPDNVWWIWKGYIGIETALNPGALFGMGAGGGFFFAAVSVVFGMGILYFVFARRALTDWQTTVSLGCILAGMLGNLYDRLGLWHPPGEPGKWRNEVRDWILFRYGSYTWPNFNIADSLLVVGVALMLWHAWRTPSDDSSSASV